MEPIFRASSHPLVLHKLSYLRQPRPYVSSRDYSSLMRELGMLLAVEATRSLPVEVKWPNAREVTEHPIRDDTAPRYYPKPRHVLKHATRPVIIPVVRSGLTMAEGVREILPTPYMGHIGIYFDPETASTEVTEFMVTMPESVTQRTCIIVDPFIDSGRAALHAIRIVREYGVAAEHIHFLCLCMARRGREALLNAPLLSGGVSFYCGRIDGISTPDDPDWMADFRDLNVRLYRTPNKQPIRE